MTASSLGVRIEPTSRVLWVQSHRLSPNRLKHRAKLELLEFRDSADKALAQYEKMAHSANPAFRAGVC